MKKERYYGYGRNMDQAVDNLLLTITAIENLAIIPELFQSEDNYFVINWEDFILLDPYFYPNAICGHHIHYVRRQIANDNILYTVWIERMGYQDISKLKTKKDD